MRTDHNWIQTYTGRQFWPLDPSPAEIDIRDIAHALALKCRYTGHCRTFYSVAQHSVIVSGLVPMRDALWGLLHDAAEAYLADVARPVKPALAGWQEIEDRVLQAIATRYDLAWPIPKSVHDADLVALATERVSIMGPPPRAWSTAALAIPLTLPIVPIVWERAEGDFLARWDELQRA